MRIPVSWLKEYLDLTIGGDKLAEAFTLSGTKIEAVEKTPLGEVLVAEITSNRADCLSIRGLAVELGAVLGKRVKKAPAFKIPSAKNTLAIRVKILDKKVCSGYSVRIFDEVQVGASPSGLITKLRLMNQEPVNNVVDITNFCLFESGQPLHAFDYDKIRGKKIIIRKAVKGEKFTGINGAVYELDESIPVIADEERVIAIAGVMGGKDTEITAQTRRVALESARFDPVAVRNAARKLKISTASSYRFERGIDPAKVKSSQERAAELLIRWTQAKPASALKTAGAFGVHAPKKMDLNLERAAEILHTPLNAKQSARQLAALGVQGRVISDSLLRVSIEPSRPDLAIEEDFVEELARINGYERIPATLPSARFAFEPEMDSGEYRLHRAIRAYLTAQGLWETMSYSLVSEELLKRCGLEAAANIRVKNGLTLEQAFLKPSGLPGMLNALAFNARRKEKDLRFFEIARQFTDGGEKTTLSLAAMGSWSRTWEGQDPASFAKLKGLVENLVESSDRNAEGLCWKESEGSGGPFEHRLVLSAKARPMGFVARVKNAVLQGMDLLEPVYFAELDLDGLVSLPKRNKEYLEVPRTPAARRDLAILINQKYRLAEIEQTLREAAGASLVGFTLFDEYKGKNIPEALRSLAFSLQYQKNDGTFKDEEIQAIHQGVVDSLKSRFNAELR